MEDAKKEKNGNKGALKIIRCGPWPKNNPRKQNPSKCFPGNVPRCTLSVGDRAAR